MVTIEITKSGVYGQNGPIPVGTVLDVPHEPTGWANKYRVVSSDEDKTLQPATPDHALEAADELELSELRAEYERAFGEKPHARMKAETIRRKLSEVEDD